MDAEPASDGSAQSPRKYYLFAAVFALALAADQLTKWWARAALAPHGSRTVIDGFFDLRYSENPGSAFGLFRNVPGARWILLAIGIGAMVVVITLLRRLKPGPGQLRVAAELGLLAGGALGNIVDRVWQTRVTDFIVWKWHEHEWPTFNIADAALVVGVIALLFDMKSDEKKKEAPASARGKRKRRA
jgi:signal peptidase II